MAKDYQKLQQEYAAELAKAKNGDVVARETKGKIMSEIRQAERESARAGTVLNPIADGRGQIRVETKKTSSRQSLQEEYVRKFNDTAKLEIPVRNGETFSGTLRYFHAKRLLAR